MIAATNAAFDEQTFGNRDAKAKLRLMPDEIADGDIPGPALVLPVPTLQDHPHLHATTGTKSVADIPTAPEQNPQPEHHASIDHNTNGDIEATMMTVLVLSQAPDEGRRHASICHYG